MEDNQSYGDNGWHSFSYVFPTFLFLSAALVFAAPCLSRNRFNAHSLYQSKLKQYGDFDQNGTISDEERTRFNKRVFQGKTVYYDGEMKVKKKNGGNLSSGEIMDILNAYNPEKK